MASLKGVVPLNVPAIALLKGRVVVLFSVGNLMAKLAGHLGHLRKSKEQALKERREQRPESVAKHVGKTRSDIVLENVRKTLKEALATCQHM